MNATMVLIIHLQRNFPKYYITSFVVNTLHKTGKKGDEKVYTYIANGGGNIFITQSIPPTGGI